MSLLGETAVVRSYCGGKFDIVPTTCYKPGRKWAVEHSYCDRRNPKTNVPVGVDAVEPGLRVAEVPSLPGAAGPCRRVLWGVLPHARSFPVSLAAGAAAGRCGASRRIHAECRVRAPGWRIGRRRRARRRVVGR